MNKTMIVAQIFISCMMACLMSGIMGLIVLGPTEVWLESWPRQFITAWPIAFVLSLVVGPIAFRLAGRLTRKQPAR
jgi:cytochrome c biogenesis factor